MHILAFVGALTLSALASAKPIESQSGRFGTKAAFSVSQSRPKAFVKSGPAALASVYGKYNKQIPLDVKAAVNNNEGTVVANPEEYDSEYLSPVEIGGQTLNLDFDTGSSDLWVFSTELKSSVQEGHSNYNPSKSPTSKLLEGESFLITYGDESGAAGIVYTDTVKVGATTAKDQAVEVAQQVSEAFAADEDSDGLLGLGFGSINQVKPTRQKTFFDNVKDTLARQVFTVDLKKNAPGTYDFGFIDRKKYLGKITYLPVNPENGWWQFTSNGYAIGNGNLTRASITGIIDTGTTLMMVPQNIAYNYWRRVPGSVNDAYQRGYTFPCKASLPSFTIGFGKYKAVVPGRYLNYAPLGSSDPTEEPMCFGGLQESGGLPVAIFGDVFIKSQFIVFDREGPRLGIAPKKL